MENVKAATQKKVIKALPKYKTPKIVTYHKKELFRLTIRGVVDQNDSG